MLGLNFLILIGTGTRGPILALVLMVLYYFYDISRQYLKGKTKFLIPLLCSLLVITSAVYLQLDNIKKRSFERTTETGSTCQGVRKPGSTS